MNEQSRQLGRQTPEHRFGPRLDGLRMAGLNHRTAPVELRERLAVVKGDGSALLESVHEQFPLKEVVVLSTCNRVEFYWTESGPVDGARLIAAVAAQRAATAEAGTPASSPLSADSTGLDAEIASHVYRHEGAQAAGHLFQVAVGLDSLVVGETQILHQVKRAYERSLALGLTGPVLNPLFQKSLQMAKEVHTKTRLTAHQASVPAVALDLAEAIFGDLTSTSVLVVGTGEMAQLTFESLRKRGVQPFAFISRSSERARAWSETHSSPVLTPEALPDVLPRADIVVACTASQQPIVTAEMVRRALAARPGRSRPLLILDLGLPRNVDADVRRIEQVYLHDLDGLEAVVEGNRRRQEREVVAARELLSMGLESYCRECLVWTASSTIQELRARTEGMAREELARSLNRMPDLTEGEREQVGLLVHRILGKVLHGPTRALKEASENGCGVEGVRWARRIFGMEKEQAEDDP